MTIFCGLDHLEADSTTWDEAAAAVYTVLLYVMVRVVMMLCGVVLQKPFQSEHAIDVV